MSAEDCIVDVDGVSSSESENDTSGREEDEDIDVEADEGLADFSLDSGSDDEDESSEGAGAGGFRARKGHHNELEKKRRKALNASYATLKRQLKKMKPGCRLSGRDRTLEMGNKFLRQKLHKLEAYKQQVNNYLQKFKEEYEETTDEHRRQEISRAIAELSGVENPRLKFVLPPPSSSSQSGSKEETPGTSVGTSDEDGQSEEDDAGSVASSSESCVHEDDDIPTPVGSP